MAERDDREPSPGGLESGRMSGGLESGLDDLVGRSEREVRSRLGAPDVERSAGGNRWLVYEREALTLRIRCRRPEADRPCRVASWTATLAAGRATLREAAEPLGLWPLCAPDADARSAEGPSLRRAIRGGDAVHSLTARVRAGSIDQITVFDEAPEWDVGLA